MGTMFVSLHNSFQTKDYRVFRASLFAGLGLTGIVPIIHGWYLNYEIAAVHRALGLDVIMGVIYLVCVMTCCYCCLSYLNIMIADTLVGACRHAVIDAL